MMENRQVRAVFFFQAGGQRTDMTKVMVAFRNFANTPTPLPAQVNFGSE